MRQSLLFLTSCLSLISASSLIARDDPVGANTIRLYYKDCKDVNGQKGEDIIYNAWEDAIKIAKAVGTINFQDVAAVDFFGPPSKNKNYQQAIQDVFNNVITFNQGFSANPIKWPSYAQCGAASDLKDKFGVPKCQKPGLRAYTWNSKDNDGIGAQKPFDSKDAYTYMHFCDSFFLYKRVDDVITDISKQSADWKYDLSKYKNTGYIMLHEMMHANMITYKQNKNRHIVDMAMDIYKWVWDSGRKYTRKLIRVDAYGAQNARILARTQTNGIATDITLNADNFAQFALAVYVRKKLDGGNGYPYLPIADQGSAGEIHPKVTTVSDGSGWGVNAEPFEANLKADDLSFTVQDVGVQSDSVDDPNIVLSNLGWIPDSDYPADYIKQRDSWVKQRDGSSTSVPTASPTGGQNPPAPTVSSSCNGLGSKKYVSQPALAGNIKDFCSQAAKQGTLDQNSGSIARNFNKGALDEVDISMDWTPGLDFKPNENDCNKIMNGLSDNCDGNDPKNPMNWKGGGKAVQGKVTYNVVPKADRQPLPNTPGGGCDVRWKVVLDKFWIWGNGYATTSYGQEPNGLLAQIKGCGATTEWKFTYGLGDDGREWSAEGQNLVFTSACIARAIKSAGGPGIDCSGDR